MDGKTLGILGLGSQTTTFYLKELNRIFNIEQGGYSTCPIVLFNTNFNAINSLLPDVSEELDEIVQRYISEIENMEIEHLIVPNITLHETIERIHHKSTLLHPVDLSLSKIKENQWTQVVLFGSIHTTQSSYMRSKFTQNNIELLLPTKEDRQFIDQVRKAVYTDSQTKELLNKYHITIEKYTAKNPVILACTELSIFKPKNKNVLDMAQVQIEKAIKIILQKQ